MSDVVSGWGCVFKLHNGTTLTELAEIFAANPPNDEAGEYETTHFKSAGRRKSFKAGLIDGGMMEIEGNWIPGSATDLLLSSAKAAGTVRTFELIVPTHDLDTWKFAGSVIVKGYEKAIPLDDRMTFKATMRVSGDVTETLVSG
jgi:predicted secreted protein